MTGARPRVAIAHDYLTQRGGAERVVLAMARAFPDARIHTTLYDPEATYPEFADHDIVTSPLNRIGPVRRDHRLGGARQVWQRQPATLRLLAARDGVRGAAWRRAVALWRPAPWGGTMLLTVVAADAGAAREALGAMAGALPSPLTLFNEPEGGPVAEALRGLGFARYDRQHELLLEPVGRD